MELDVYTKQGDLAGRKVRVPKQLFEVEPHEHAIYLAVKAQRTNSRQGTRATKNRSQVSGGGRKPWRQKGRGTARAGTTRSPIWRGGGTTFGPQPHDFYVRVPKKVKRLARISAFSAKAREQQIKILEDFTLDVPKTKEMTAFLKSFDLVGNKTLVLLPEHDKNIMLASRNIKNLRVVLATDVSTYDLLNCDNLLIMESAVKQLKGALL